MPADVVVAVDEELLDGVSVRALVAGEHLEPGVRHDRELRLHATIRQIAGDAHAVHADRAKMLKRKLELPGRLLARHVDVADDADPETTLPRGQPCNLRRG